MKRFVVGHSVAVYIFLAVVLRDLSVSGQTSSSCPTDFTVQSRSGAEALRVSNIDGTTSVAALRVKQSGSLVVESTSGAINVLTTLRNLQLEVDSVKSRLAALEGNAPLGTGAPVSPSSKAALVLQTTVTAAPYTWTVRHNVGDALTLSGDQTKITFGRSGTYLVGAVVRTTSTGDHHGWIQRSGSAYERITHWGLPTPGIAHHNVVGVSYFAAGDAAHVELYFGTPLIDGANLNTFYAIEI